MNSWAGEKRQHLLFSDWFEIYRYCEVLVCSMGLFDFANNFFQSTGQLKLEFEFPYTEKP